MIQPLAYALAALIGLSLGLMGGGGSILTVPIFVYVLGFDPKRSIAMSLPVVGATSLIGAIGHWRAGNVNLKTATLFGVVAMAGAYVGARLAFLLTGAMQLALLAIVMLAAAVSMLRSARRDQSAGERHIGGEGPISIALLVPVAIGVGLLTGLVGIGGGFLVVPALVLLGRVPMKQAVGTSLLVIAMNSVSGFAGYLGRIDVPWDFMASFTAVAVAGILAGTYLVRFVSQAVLKRAFAVFLLLMGAFVLYKNRGAFRTVTAALPRAPFGTRPPPFPPRASL
ncbi:MAG: sulfite exporter TauE/SafE family protein [Gemmatimonadaceae bacterium]